MTVRHLSDTLEAEVYKAGPTTGPVTPGQGMRGMAERVALYGGQVDVGPPDGGFRVKARFPLKPGEGA